MIVVLGSVRGSPGVTSWSLLTGASWPSERGAQRVVLEADTDGGVLGSRYGIGVDPGVAALLAAARRVDDPRHLPIADIGRHLAEGLFVVPGPETAEAGAAVWSSRADAELLADHAARDERVWVVDAGRLQRSSTVAAFAERSQLTVVLTHVGQEDLVQVPARVAALRMGGVDDVGVLMLGRSGYDRAELRSFFDTALVWGADRSDELPTIAGAALTNRRARRSWIWRSAVEVVRSMADHVVAARAVVT